VAIIFQPQIRELSAVKIGVSEWLKNSCVRGRQFLPLIRRLRHSPNILSTQTGFQGLMYRGNYFSATNSRIIGQLKLAYPNG